MKIYTKVTEPADVRVLIPYTKRRPLLQTVVDCLRIQQVQPELHKVDDGDAYWRLLRDTWAEGREFFVVEQDVIVWQGGIRALEECTESWCTYPTMCHGRMISTTLGAVKFGSQLLERNPGIWDDIDPEWFHLDAHFADKMGWPYIKPHAHWPPATHVNEVQWGDELSTREPFGRKIVWQSKEAGGEAVVKALNSEGTVSNGTVEIKEAV